MFGGAVASVLRQRDYQRIYDKIQEFYGKSEKELDSIISNYKSKNLFYRIFANMEPGHPDCFLDYKGAKAVKNMNFLGLDKFPIKKLSVFGIMDALDYLEEKFKQKKNLENKVKYNEKIIKIPTKQENDK